MDRKTKGGNTRDKHSANKACANNQKKKDLIRFFSLFLLVIFSLVLLSGVGNAQTCDADLNIDGSGRINNTCTIATGTTLIVNGTYNINMNGSVSGAIVFNNNIILDCNGSTIYGNSSTVSVGLGSSGVRNLTVRNCKLQNYNRGMFLSTSNSTIYNNQVYDFIDTGIRIGTSVNVTVSNNSVYNGGANSYGIAYTSSGHYFNISNNWVNNTLYGIATPDTNYTYGKIYNNNVFNTSSTSLLLWANASYLNIYDNIILNSRYNGIMVGGRNNLIYNNNITNFLHHGLDVHDDGNISLFNNLSFYSNLIKQIDSAFSGGLWGIAIWNANNVNISNNQLIDLYNSTESQSGSFGRGIIISKGDLTENVSIENNILSNISGNCFVLRAKNIYLNNNNISNCDRQFYIERYPEFIGNISSVSIRNMISNTINLWSVFINNNETNINYTLPFTSQSHLFNYSGVGTSSITKLNGLTNTLIYFSNNSVACSIISTCDNNINITLTPQNYSYVLDNFNITEGVTRQFSPVSVSGSSISKTITSSLTDSITATVIVNVPNCSFDATYKGVSITEESCSNGQATFNLQDIPNGSSLLLLSYGVVINGGVCDSLLNLHTLTAGNLVLIFLTIVIAIILSVVLGISYFSGDQGDGPKVTPYAIILVFILMMVAAILLATSALITTSLCAL